MIRKNHTTIGYKPIDIINNSDEEIHEKVLDNIAK